MTRAWRTIVLPLVLVMSSAAPVGADVPGRPRPALAPASCDPGWSIMVSPNPGDWYNSLLAVEALSATDAWAVGEQTSGGAYKDSATLIEHWDGTGWSVVPSPNGGPGNNLLLGIDAASASDIWAVGYSVDVITASAARTLIEHWDGANWSVVPSPNLGAGDNYLYGVAALSPTDVWAVGSHETANGIQQTLTARWNGTGWSVVPSPNVGAASNFLNALSAVSAGDIWAVGGYWGNGALQTLTERWDGTGWNVVPSPNQGTGLNHYLSASSALRNSAWAVGSYNGVQALRALAMRWNGTSWVLSGSQLGGLDGRLLGLEAISWGNVWGVGSNFAGGFVHRLLTVHWDGTRWKVIPNVGGSGATGVLYDVAASPDGDVWTVGSSGAFYSGAASSTIIRRICPIRVLDSAFSPGVGSVRLGNTVVWAFSRANGASHSVTDGSGMGLFDSGMRSPGGSYTFQFTAAGSYPIIDVVTSNTGTIEISPDVKPSSGGPSTMFTITWATAAPPSGYVFDVQIQQPGSPSFVDWSVGQTARSAQFQADAGAGTYSFRARLRNTANGQASGFSPAASITVGAAQQA